MAERGVPAPRTPSRSELQLAEAIASRTAVTSRELLPIGARDSLGALIRDLIPAEAPPTERALVQETVNHYIVQRIVHGLVASDIVRMHEQDSDRLLGLYADATRPAYEGASVMLLAEFVHAYIDSGSADPLNASRFIENTTTYTQNEVMRLLSSKEIAQYANHPAGHLATHAGLLGPADAGFIRDLCNDVSLKWLARAKMSRYAAVCIGVLAVLSEADLARIHASDTDLAIVMLCYVESLRRRISTSVDPPHKALFRDLVGAGYASAHPEMLITLFTLLMPIYTKDDIPQLANDLTAAIENLDMANGYASFGETTISKSNNTETILLDFGLTHWDFVRVLHRADDPIADSTTKLAEHLAARGGPSSRFTDNLVFARYDESNPRPKEQIKRQMLDLRLSMVHVLITRTPRLLITDAVAEWIADVLTDANAQLETQQPSEAHYAMWWDMIRWDAFGTIVNLSRIDTSSWAAILVESVRSSDMYLRSRAHYVSRPVDENYTSKSFGESSILSFCEAAITRQEGQEDVLFGPLAALYAWAGVGRPTTKLLSTLTSSETSSVTSMVAWICFMLGVMQTDNPRRCGEPDIVTLFMPILSTTNDSRTARASRTGNHSEIAELANFMTLLHANGSTQCQLEELLSAVFVVYSRRLTMNSGNAQAIRRRIGAVHNMLAEELNALTLEPTATEKGDADDVFALIYQTTYWALQTLDEPSSLLLDNCGRDLANMTSEIVALSRNLSINSSNLQQWADDLRAVQTPHSSLPSQFGIYYPLEESGGEKIPSVNRTRRAQTPDPENGASLLIVELSAPLQLDYELDEWTFGERVIDRFEEARRSSFDVYAVARAKAIRISHTAPTVVAADLFRGTLVSSVEALPQKRDRLTVESLPRLIGELARTSPTRSVHVVVMHHPLCPVGGEDHAALSFVRNLQAVTNVHALTVQEVDFAGEAVYSPLPTGLGVNFLPFCASIIGDRFAEWVDNAMAAHVVQGGTILDPLQTALVMAGEVLRLYLTRQPMPEPIPNAQSHFKYTRGSESHAAAAASVVCLHGTIREIDATSDALQTVVVVDNPSMLADILALSDRLLRTNTIFTFSPSMLSRVFAFM